jgi:hypothetical protein
MRKYLKINIKYSCLVGFIFILFLNAGFSQELNTGLNTGIAPIANEVYFSTGLNLEYRPKSALISLNTDPFLMFNSNQSLVTLPLYLKAIVGDKLRLSPSGGGFLRTTQSYGWVVGLQIEYTLKDKVILFSKNEFYRDYRKVYYPNPYINKFNSVLLSVGMRLKLLDWNKV